MCVFVCVCVCVCVCLCVCGAREKIGFTAKLLCFFQGREFEERIKHNEAGNAKFNFLNPHDPYHAYYQHKIKEIQEGVAQELASTHQTQPLVSFLSTLRCFVLCICPYCTVVWDDDMGYGNDVLVFFQKQFCNSLYYLKFKTKNEIDEI